MTIHDDDLDTCFMCGAVITYTTRVRHIQWHDRLNRKLFQHVTRAQAEEEPDAVTDARRRFQAAFEKLRQGNRG